MIGGGGVSDGWLEEGAETVDGGSGLAVFLGAILGVGVGEAR
jgi:hypothetical protein